MSNKTTTKPADKKSEEIKETPEEKTCFVIMPISDQEGYEQGHFDRVYKHLISPAIIEAGLKPVRADEEQITNDIRLDIIKKILESDHVICDLSARNPNVFYELGMRQAFDKSITLIKDYKTPKVFDVAGIRTIHYDENLRVDNIGPKIIEITNSIEKTLAHAETSPFENSIIRQLGITAAQPAETTEISPDTQLILERLSQLELTNHKTVKNIPRFTNKSNRSDNNLTFPYFNQVTPDETVIISDRDFPIGHHIYKRDVELGVIVDYKNNALVIEPIDKSMNKFYISFDEISEDHTYKALPF